MKIAEVQIGDLIQSKLHEGWWLQVHAVHHFDRLVRLDAFNLKLNRMENLTFAAERELTYLKNFRFVRNGELLQ